MRRREVPLGYQRELYSLCDWQTNILRLGEHYKFPAELTPFQRLILRTIILFAQGFCGKVPESHIT